MDKNKYFENYPLWIVSVSNLISIATYIIGTLIISKLGLLWLILYIIFILSLEFRLIKGHCVDCYYYGKFCAFGKGKLCSMFFNKGNPKNFCSKKMTWKDIIPDFLVSLIPIVAGIVLIIIKFDWILLSSVLSLFALGFSGNAFVRGNLACKYCRQRKLGCPAQKLFQTKNK